MKFIRPITLLSVTFCCLLAHADVVVDNTLTQAMSLDGPDYQITEALGQQVDNNLFFSFSQFSLTAKDSATFSGPLTINNILARVTGEEISYIDGVLRSTIPGADVYFLNPAGISFGPNAQLDVSGSFHVTTADYLLLGEDAHFFATHPEESRLSIESPSAFGFLSDKSPAPIHKDRALLNIHPGKDISLIGGDIKIVDSQNTIRAIDGEIRLVSLATGGEVSMQAENDAFATADLGTIEIIDDTPLTDAFSRFVANIDVSGQHGGRIYIQSGKFVLSNAYLFADSGSGDNATSGGIDINTGNLILQDTARITADALGNKSGGNINIHAANVHLEDGSQIGSTAFSSGDAGSVNLTVSDTVHASGNVSIPFGNEALLFSSGILTNTAGTGNGGDIRIEATVLEVEDKADIRADTVSNGNAGRVDIGVAELFLRTGGQILSDSGSLQNTGGLGKGGDLSINATESILIEGKSSGIRNNIFTTGEGGTTTISAPDIEITRNGAIQSGTRGSGDAGNVILQNVAMLRLSEGGFITTESLDNPNIDTEGHAGDIEIFASQGIFLSEPNSLAEANIATRTSGTGDAGDVTLIAPLIDLAQSGSIRSATESNGLGGTINIQTEQLTLNQATITAEAFDAGFAGDINLDTAVLIAENSEILTRSEISGGGNIELETSAQLQLNNSLISARAEGEADVHQGGNLTLSPPQFIILQNSRLLASAVGGNGGDILLQSDYLFRSGGSELNASSERRVDGQIIIRAPEPDLLNVEVKPPSFLTASALNEELCRVTDKTNNHLYQQGRGGLSLDEIYANDFYIN